jgi:hypothetical protein
MIVLSQLAVLRQSKVLVGVSNLPAVHLPLDPAAPIDQGPAGANQQGAKSFLALPLSTFSLADQPVIVDLAHHFLLMGLLRDVNAKWG